MNNFEIEYNIYDDNEVSIYFYCPISETVDYIFYFKYCQLINITSKSNISRDECIEYLNDNFSIKNIS